MIQYIIWHLIMMLNDIFLLSIKARRLVATSENSAKIILYFISEMLKKYLGICIEMFRNIPLSI
jgi:hypothetical protein